MRPLSFLALALFSTVSLAQKANPRAVIEGQMLKYETAIGKRDVAGVQQVLAPGFKAQALSGQTLDTAAFLKQTKQLFALAKTLKSSSSILTFRLDKGNAYLRSKNVLDFEISDRAGKLHKLHAESTAEEVWIPADGTFKVRSTRQLSEKSTVDGKALSNKTAGPPVRH